MAALAADETGTSIRFLDLIHRAAAPPRRRSAENRPRPILARLFDRYNTRAFASLHVNDV